MLALISTPLGKKRLNILSVVVRPHIPLIVKQEKLKGERQLVQCTESLEESLLHKHTEY
jgi:hypothetical protein